MAITKCSQPRYDVIVDRNVMIPMRDGVCLATDLYFPAEGGMPLKGNHPVVFHRTPYNKREVEDTLGYCWWFAERGYVSVIQDCRGTFESEGVMNFLIPEAEDGFDALHWIDQQFWSNGKVGSWGTSWSGWTQTAMAALEPKNLKAMIPNQSGANGYESSIRQGGAMELRFLAWAFWHSATNTQACLKADPKIDAALNFGAPSFSDWLTRMPIRRGQTQLRLVPSYEKWAFQIFTQSDYTDFWKHPSFAPALYWDKFPDVPILLVGGWYDSYTRATFQNFVGLSQQKCGPVRVLMGPWTHGSTTSELSYSGDVEFGKESALESFRNLHLIWFDRALKGIDTWMDYDSPVRIFVMGGGNGHRTVAGRLFHGGTWRDEQEWPLARTRFTVYYLGANGSLSTFKSKENNSRTTYQYDPSNPVPSIGGNVSSLSALGPMPSGVTDPTFAPRSTRIQEIMSPGGFDQIESLQFWGCQPPFLPLGARSDVLVFQTELLETDIEVTGPLEVNLWVSSSAVDTDFTAKLIDVYPPNSWYPNGYSLNLSDSLIRLRYRNNNLTGQLLDPGEVVEVMITLYPTSNVFVAGHRIRLDISSSNFPRFDVNPNTGDLIGLERRRVVADNTIYHNSERPSYIVLPIIPSAK